MRPHDRDSLLDRRCPSQGGAAELHHDHYGIMQRIEAVYQRSVGVEPGGRTAQRTTS